MMEKNLSRVLQLLFCFIMPYLCAGQTNVRTFGMHYKPIFQSKFITKNIFSSHNNIDFSIENKRSFSGGMVIRRGLTERFSLETGINYVKRNFEITINDTSRNFKAVSEFSVICYEIPILFLVYIRLSEKWYMNTSAGASIDFFPSDVGNSDTYFNHISVRYKNLWLRPALLANVGYEYRTEKYGYFYIGGSYHRPSGPIYLSTVKYNVNLVPVARISEMLYGNYLTLDLRYFFHEHQTQ